jgi:hypothetical protein
MRVLLFGASGMIGSGVLRESLADPGVERVISIVRKPGTVQDAKLLEIVHEDFLNFGPIESLVFNEIDAAFFCLGVASAGMKETDYTHITYGITLAAASCESFARGDVRVRLGCGGRQQRAARPDVGARARPHREYSAASTLEDIHIPVGARAAHARGGVANR